MRKNKPARGARLWRACATEPNEPRAQPAQAPAASDVPPWLRSASRLEARELRARRLSQHHPRPPSRALFPPRPRALEYGFSVCVPVRPDVAMAWNLQLPSGISSKFAGNSQALVRVVRVGNCRKFRVEFPANLLEVPALSPGWLISRKIREIPRNFQRH